MDVVSGLIVVAGTIVVAVLMKAYDRWEYNRTVARRIRAKR